MKKQSAYGRILLVRISMLAMTVIAALWWQEKAESMGIVYASETEDVQISDRRRIWNCWNQWILQILIG